MNTNSTKIQDDSEPMIQDWIIDVNTHTTDSGDL